MTEILKNWITTIFCIGIFLTFVQMIIPNTKLKKYIYSLISVITIVTLALPIKEKLNMSGIEDVTQTVINNIESKAREVDNISDTIYSSDTMDKNLKKEFIKKIKSDINQKLSDYNIYPETINILLDDSYNIKKIDIKVKAQEDKGKINTIFNCISQNYSVLGNNITIEEV